MIAWIQRLPWHFAVIAALTLGLAPFAPEPHVWEKLKLLAGGQLVKPMDIFDLLLHGAPWVMVALKAALSLRKAEAR